MIHYFLLILLLLPLEIRSSEVQLNQVKSIPLYSVGSLDIYEDGKNVTFVPLTKDRLSEIEQQEVDFEKMSKEEIAKLIVQTYKDEWIRKEMSFAYEKIKKFPHSKPSAEQEVALSKKLTGPQNRQAVYEFLLLMTKEQLMVVGY